MTREAGVYFLHKGYIAFRADDDATWRVSGMTSNGTYPSCLLTYAADFDHKWQVIEYIDAQEGS